MPTARKKMEDKKLCKTGSGPERWRKPLAFLLLVLLILLLNHWFGISPSLLTPILDFSCYLLALKFLGGGFFKTALLWRSPRPTGSSPCAKVSSIRRLTC